MYLTIYTSGPMGGSLCYCRLACNGPQQVASAAEHMSHTGPYDGRVCILPISLHRPMMAMCIFYRQACIGPIQPIVYATIYTSGPIGGACVTADDIMMAKSRLDSCRAKASYGPMMCTHAFYQ